jgi:alpha-L-rhamnosidase
MNFKPFFLRCEYVENPIGVHARRPVLSWRAESGGGSVKQRFYQITAASSPERLRAGEYDLWNSGKVADDKFYGIPFGGPPLASAQRVWWQVRIWDEADKPSELSDIAFFEMGLLEKTDWKGRWMSFLGGMIGNGLQIRYAFEVKKQPLRARAYIAGLGYNELRINGSRIGDRLLEPGATDYSKTVLYTAYDVTGELRQGENALGVILGTGWIGAPKFLLQLNIEFADGTRQEEYTDWGIGWLVSRGPIVYNSIYDGEDYDARLEKDNWDRPEYKLAVTTEHQRPGGWIHCTIVEPPGGELVGAILPPVRVTGRFEPRFLRTLQDGAGTSFPRDLYDAGANRTGWVRLRCSGDAGASVTLTFAEVLNEEGDLQMLPLRTARAQDSYTLRGDKAIEEYAPSFTYHGFRYFTVERKGAVKIESLTVEFARSDLPRNATFRCDDDFLTRMADIMWHTDACNMFSIPTDSCQRDERHGWGTDPTARIEGCTYHFDTASFFNKWLRDIFDTQSDEGYFADTAPHRWGRRPCDPQVNVPALLPLLLYRSYGNLEAVKTSYEPLKKYIQALFNEADHFIISRTGWGEWACPDEECIPEEFGPGASAKNISPAFVSTAYLYYSVILVAESAAVLGKSNEAAYYKDMSEIIRRRFNEKFFNRETAQYESGSQSANTLAVALGLAEPAYHKRIVENIAANIRGKGCHFSTGSMGTKAIVEVLCQNGRPDLVYEVMTNKTSPGFGYMLAQDATSIWERWEADRNNNIMNSRNQPMFAAAAVFFYKYLGGIGMEPCSEAFRDLVIAPCVPPALNQVTVEMDVPAGHVISSWKKTGSQFVLYISIPFNAKARVVIPGVIPDAKTLTVNGINQEARKGEDGSLQLSVPAGKYEIILRG